MVFREAPMKLYCVLVHCLASFAQNLNSLLYKLEGRIFSEMEKLFASVVFWHIFNIKKNYQSIKKGT